MNTSDNNEKVSNYHFEPTANGNQDNESMTDIPTLLSISTSATPNSELIDNKNSDKQVVNSDLLLSAMKPTVLPSIYNTTIYTFSNYTSLSISTHDSTLSNNEQEKSKSDKNTISQLDIISTPVPNTIIKPTHKHTPTYQLIIVITTDKEVFIFLSFSHLSSKSLQFLRIPSKFLVFIKESSLSSVFYLLLQFLFNLMYTNIILKLVELLKETSMDYLS